MSYMPGRQTSDTIVGENMNKEMRKSKDTEPVNKAWDEKCGEVPIYVEITAKPFGSN